MEYITEGGDMYENCSGKEPEVPVRHSPHDIRHKKRGRITEKGAQCALLLAEQMRNQTE